MSEENKKDRDEAGNEPADNPNAPESGAEPAAEAAGRPAEAGSNEPADTQAVAGGEPAGAGAEHPNQPQPDAAAGEPAAEPAPAPAGEAAGQGASDAAPEAPALSGAEGAVDPEREAKLKAAAEARAARLAAKAAAEGGEAPAAGTEGAVDPEREAKLKAAAEARAARAAAKAAAEGGEAPAAGADVDPEKAAKIKAAAEARAARLAAKAAAEGGEGGEPAAPAEPKPPSPKQPWLDEAVELLKTLVHADAVEEAAINELSGDMPTLTVKAEHWPAAATLLRDHEKLGCNYLRNVSGVDYETHLEVDYFVVNLTTKREYMIKVRTDRESPSVPSATPVWPTADWPEREIYDLLGVDFPGHPDLRRIMMPDDWVGHPLRKDYVPFDPEV